MLDTAKVTRLLTTISPLTAEELASYSDVIAAAAAAFEDSEDEQTSTRLALIAAARANYLIALAQSGDSRITSFKAGDVSITESTDAVAAAKALMEEMESTGHGITADSGFVFQTV